MQNSKLSVDSSRFTVRNGFSAPIIIIMVALVAVVVLALLVFDVGKLKTPILQPRVTDDRILEELKTVGTSDEVQDIEKDLVDTDLETIDAEISEVDRDVQSL